MKIETTQTTKQVIDIPVPSFYRDKNCHDSITDLIGILDENTVVKVWESDKRTALINGDLDSLESDIVRAFLNWEPITEEKFFYHHNRALHSLSLTPELSIK